MDKKEFQEKVSEQLRIKKAADDEIKRLRQEYIDSALIKVGDIVHPVKVVGDWPKGQIVIDESSEVRISSLGIAFDNDIGVKYINRKKKNGEFSERDEVPCGGIYKDGVHYTHCY